MHELQMMDKWKINREALTEHLYFWNLNGMSVLKKSQKALRLKLQTKE